MDDQTVAAVSEDGQGTMREDELPADGTRLTYKQGLALLPGLLTRQTVRIEHQAEWHTEFIFSGHVREVLCDADTATILSRDFRVDVHPGTGEKPDHWQVVCDGRSFTLMLHQREASTSFTKAC